MIVEVDVVVIVAASLPIRLGALEYLVQRMPR